MKIIYFLILSYSYVKIQAQDTSIIVNSSIQIPFKLTFKKLEETTNLALPTIIYKDSSHTNNDNDQLKISVIKNGKITISSIKNNVLKIDVPLKVWCEKGVGALGVYAYQNTSFQLVMSYQMVYNVAPNWQLMTKTIKNGYTWIQKPVLKFSSIEIPITPIVEKILDKQQASSSQLIDAQIKRNIDLKKDILTIWNMMKKPSLISEEYKTWMQISPLGISATPFIQDRTAIISKFKIDVINETFIGNEPEKTEDDITLPNLKYIQQVPDQFELFTTVNVPYSEATSMAKTKLLNQEMEFKDGKYKIKITDINIRNQEQNLLIEADMIGSFKGKVIIQGIPYYDSTTQAIKLKDLAFDMKTKNVIFKAANWLFNGKIESELSTNFEIPLKETLSVSITSTNQALNQTRNGVKFLGQISEMKPTEVRLGVNQMTIIILSKGKIQLEM